jgi:hypothetical protein
MNGFSHEGYTCHTYTSRDLPSCTGAQRTPKIIFCDVVSSPFEDDKFRRNIEAYRNNGAKILLWLYWPLNDQPYSRSEAIAKYNVADLYIGEREHDAMVGFEVDTGLTYNTVPMFANSSRYNTADFNPALAYDVAFVGAKLPKKKWFNEGIIKPLQAKYNVGLFGTNWTFSDNVKRAASKGLRIGHLNKLAKFVDSSRFTISEFDEMALYASSKICLNFHEREPDLTQPHHIVNHRAFKIVACGGFQICDRVKGMANYFKEDELCMVDCNEKQWFERIEYFIHADKERQQYVECGMKRVSEEHLDFHRVRHIESLLFGY